MIKFMFNIYQEVNISKIMAKQESGMKPKPTPKPAEKGGGVVGEKPKPKPKGK